MSYVTVGKNRDEYICEEKPQRQSTKDICWYGFGVFVDIPKGSIKKLIGHELTWEDEPVELKENGNG